MLLECYKSVECHKNAIRMLNVIRIPIRAAGYKTTLVSQVPRIIEDDNVIMAPGPGKTPVSELNHGHFEELAFPYLLLTGTFGYKLKLGIPISHAKCCNRRLLNLRQSFASDLDYLLNNVI